MVCQIPSELAEKSYQVLGELVGGSANITDNGSHWDFVYTLWILLMSGPLKLEITNFTRPIM
jgi:hypothetical protein